MAVTVVGSLAFDTIHTASGSAEDVMGGSATFFAAAAAYFGQVRLVGIVGEDFPEAFRDELKDRDIDVAGLETKPGRTFRWEGKYSDDMNERETLNVELNAFGEFEPTIPEAYRESEVVFLANAAPKTQLKVLEQMERPKFVACDTMDLWIETAWDDLQNLLGKVDCVTINDGEVRDLTGHTNLYTAARMVLGWGPSAVIVKKGEHGAICVTNDGSSALPAYPVERLVDPTGAGDSFAGGLCGYLAEHGDFGLGAMKRGLAYGTICASFAVQGFSLHGFRNVDRDDIDQRLEKFQAMLAF
jgi:sugar/nucleoside kinase (ribokinase family)